MSIDNPHVDAVPEPLAVAAAESFAQLPDIQREAIAIAHEEKIDYRAIADRLEHSPEDVADAIRDGLKTLFSAIDVTAATLLDSDNQSTET